MLRGPKVEKALKVALARGVKLHVFKPSNREIWTIVGKDNEYWVDPERHFCSCKDYYFQTLSGKSKCYHLQIIDVAKEKQLIDVVEFGDEEYNIFLQGLIKDIFLAATR